MQVLRFKHFNELLLLQAGVSQLALQLALVNHEGAFWHAADLGRVQVLAAEHAGAVFSSYNGQARLPRGSHGLVASLLVLVALVVIELFDELACQLVQDSPMALLQVKLPLSLDALLRDGALDPLLHGLLRRQLPRLHHATKGRILLLLVGLVV